jgi:hypothetical protein
MFSLFEKEQFYDGEFWIIKNAVNNAKCISFFSGKRASPEMITREEKGVTR